MSAVDETVRRVATTALFVVAVFACHRAHPRPPPSVPVPADARGAASADAGVAADAAITTGLACPAGATLHASTWTYQEGKVSAPVQWCELADGTKHGPWRKTLANGELVEQGEYDHGQLDGLWSSYFFSHGGGLSQQGTYVAGAKHGTWHKWWGSGALAETDVFEHGTPVSAMSFDPNGRLELSGSYVAGEMSGEWSWFAPDGSPTKQVIFAHGKPLKGWRWKDGKRTVLPLSQLDDGTFVEGTAATP